MLSAEEERLEFEYLRDLELRRWQAVLDETDEPGSADYWYQKDTNRELIKPHEHLTPDLTQAITKTIHNLVLCNLALAGAYANRYRTKAFALGHTWDDLIQVGSIGLIKAIQRYDYSKNFRFGTYARFWVRHAIQRMLIEGLDVHITSVGGNLRAAPFKAQSLDAPVSHEGDDTLHDILAAPEEAPEVVLEDSVVDAIAKLPKRQQTIIELYFYEGLTLKQIGEHPSIYRRRVNGAVSEKSLSRERIRQLLVKSFEQLRQELQVEL